MLEIIGALVIFFIGVPLLFSLMTNKWFWICTGSLIILIIIGIISATPKKQVSAISPTGELTSPLPNCTNPTIQDPCGTFDTNVYPLTVQPITPGTQSGY